jgi:hypothetical protein|tara:strand:- start:282 stop:677 length:396 start_codon:yes stop_codon:yes gene_type:complete
MEFKNEKDIKRYLLGLLDLKDTANFNRYCDYDLYGKDCLIELKARKKDYDEVLIEASKYIRIMRKAKITNKAFYYIVSSPNHLYYFDMGSIPLAELKAEEIRCPLTTEFENNEYISKECYLIPSKYKRLIV